VSPVTDIATVLDTLGIVVSPVHEPTEIIPLVHTSYLDPVTDSDRHGFGEVDVMGDKQGFAIPDVQDETLVPGTVVVVRQQPHDDTPEFNPGSCIRLFETTTHTTPISVFILFRGQGGTRLPLKNAASHPWPPRFA
jgi:hypothetical protein